MARETVGTPDWEALFWEETPYPGVFVFKLDEEINPENPDMPLLSVFALKVNPNSQIPRHIHKREPEWREQVTSYEPGDFEILRADGSEKISSELLVITIKPYEVFGVINNGPRPLFFTSRMVPGFTGYEEIEEINQQGVDSQA
ncbi:MAG: hypothetical protein HY427_02965 [Candidatus Levybacteria bacterium]|nr:hypothetical protein [Candidatus Levybacteria bacterium]